MMGTARKDHEYLAVYSDTSAVNGNGLEMNLKLVHSPSFKHHRHSHGPPSRSLWDEQLLKTHWCPCEILVSRWRTGSLNCALQGGGLVPYISG